MKNKSSLKSQFPSLKQHQKLANEVATLESSLQRYDVEMSGRKALENSIKKLQKSFESRDDLGQRIESLEEKVASLRTLARAAACNLDGLASVHCAEAWGGGTCRVKEDET